MRGADVALRVAAVIEGDGLRLDFSGTDPQVPGNLNCPLSVTKSAAFFAVRVLADPDAPPSAGAHRPVEVVAPEGCVVHARPPAAVAGGNVETSSRIADLVLEALGGATPAPAQGQGTMNNLTLAGEGFTYYETIGGGQGGCPDADGPERDPRRDVEHPQHARRGLRERVPAPGPRAIGPSRQRRRRAPSRRRRDRPRARGARAGAAQPDHRAPPPRSTRAGGRRGRRARAQPAQRRAAAVEGRPRPAPPATGCESRPRAGAATGRRTPNRLAVWRSGSTSAR